MADWKDQLKDLYKSYSTSQKNTKGTTSKFDTTSHRLLLQVPMVLSMDHNKY